MRKLPVLALLITLMTLTSCRDAQVASRNLSKSADQFELYRQVVFYNGITNEYILVIKGYCSVEERNGRLSVTVKDKNGYKKHYLGLSDNVTYFSQQIDSKDVSDDRYRVIFKPSVVLPNIDVQ